MPARHQQLSRALGPMGLRQRELEQEARQWEMGSWGAGGITSKAPSQQATRGEKGGEL